jgi:hypothetical protein
MTKVVSYIEIDAPVCSLTCGTSPCTATPVTGGECFNSRKTCIDLDDDGLPINYAETTKTVRFGYPDADDKSGIDHIPSMTGISYRPQKISLAEDLGVRASITVTLHDHPDADTCGVGDPYWQTRGYNPYEQGTFWGKFRARYPYMQGAILRYYQGTEGQTLPGMDVRSFVIDKISGPSLDGKVTITAKDVLKLADDDKAQCPVISTGRLANDITSSQTTCTLLPTGIGDEEYPTRGYITLGGKEVCYFTRSGDALTLTRANFYTEASEHKASDLVQLCKWFFDLDTAAGMDPADILYDLFVNYTNINPAWIPIDDWRSKTATYINRRYYALIAEPTSVRDLATEIVEQTGIILFGDDISSDGVPYIRLDVVRQQPDVLRAFDEETMVEGSFSVADQPDKRISQVWTYYGQRNPTEKLDDTSNYSAAVAVVDEDAEEAYGQPAIKKIFSRWIPRNNRPAASDLDYRLLARFRDAPRLFEFATWRHSGDVTTVLSLAARYTVTGWPLQLPSGEQTTANVQVTELDPGDAKMSATAQEILWHEYPDEPELPQTVIFDQDQVNVNLRTEYDKSYPAPESGDTVTFVVETDVVIGSSSTGSPAMTVGVWPAGVTLVLTNTGYIVGRGGNGGDGGCACLSNGRAGGYGGPALYSRQAITITNNGIIGGGGGGGGGGAGIDGGYAGPGGGGGGGAGYVAGSGGDGELGGGCWWTAYDGAPGTLTAGGAGGDAWRTDAGTGGTGGSLGQAGSVGGEDTYRKCGTIPGAGGAAGNAVDGNSYITWTTVGDVRGARIN